MRQLAVLRNAHKIIWMAVLGASLLSTALVAEELPPAKKSVAAINIGTTRIDWLPLVADYERLVLTVAGPGDLYIQREFGAGETPFFSSLNGPDGQLLDGVYAYELRTVPKAQRLTEETLVQSGHLWVQGGSFVTRVPIRSSTPDQEGASKSPIRKLVADVVQGRSCIGNGCVAGNDNVPALNLREDFDTRITFDNSGCCHPSTRDWALQANDVLSATGDFLIRDLTQGTIPFRIGSSVPDNAFTIFPSNGNIGLGTLTPAVRLDVKASVAGQAAARLQNSSATGFSGTEYLDNAGNVDLFFGIDNAASTTRLNSVNNNPIVILTNSTERMRITSATLHVASGEVRIPGGTASVNGWPTHFRWPLDGKNYIRGTTVIADDGGSVGIGTQTPSSKLHVNGGDIRVSGGSFIDDGVTLNAPDYVFEPAYRLMPLNELREFVSRERHLPNVPSANDIKKDGLNLGQVQMRLLEKLEELTLYTLKQDEQVQSLQNENAKLNARLAALEKAAEAEPQQ